jgi:hypothetical protein
VTTRSDIPKEDLAPIAAIAVAILRDRRKSRGSPLARKARSAWKHYGRARQIGL